MARITPPRHDLVGSASLVRFALRRDRVKLPAWLVGISAFWLYYTRLIPVAYPELEQIEGLLTGPAGRVYTGPNHGFDELSYDRVITGGYGLYLLLLVALMNLLMVARHTRLEEQEGRTDLVRARPVGRLAPLVAALVVAGLANAAVTVLVALISATSPHLDLTGSLLFAASTGAVGLVFAAITAAAAQLADTSRATAGVGGGLLGAAFVIRAVGDLPRPGGTALSWLSPLAWSQQTAPFVLDRWWPLLLSALLTVALVAGALWSAARRDVGSGLLAARVGPSRGPGWLGSPVALAVRLQWASIAIWAVSFAVAGATFGAFADVMLESVDDLPEVLLDVLGGTEDLTGGYLAYMAVLIGNLAAVQAVLAVQGIRADESAGRADPVLAAPVARGAWLGAPVLVVLGGVVLGVAVAGVATGVTAAIVTGQAELVGTSVVAHLAQLPAVAVVLGLAVLLVGLAPRLLGVIWALVGYSFLAGTFGEVLGLPSWSQGLSPFHHVGQHPVEPLSAVSLVALAAVAAVAVVAGLIGVGRRPIDVR